VFDELSHHLEARPVASWRTLAEDGDLVRAAYNDAVPYAEVLVIERGQLIRHYLRDEQDPTQDVDLGHLPEEAGFRVFTGWADAMGWVENDADTLVRPPEGWLWIHRLA
jgi:hypothetical protein